MIFDIILSVLSFDIWFYVFHYALHNVYLYSKIHKIHHQIGYDDLNFTNSLTSHIIEKPLSYIGLFIPYIFIQDVNNNSFIISFLFIIIRDALRHDKRFIWLVGEHHLLHHKYPQYNFGEQWLDRFFWTEY